MKYYVLTEEEQKELDEIEAALENGGIESLPNLEDEKNDYRKLRETR